MDKIIAKKNKKRRKDNPYSITPKEKLHITDPIRLSKGQTAIDPKTAVCLTARQFASWTGNYITQEEK